MQSPSTPFLRIFGWLVAGSLAVVAHLLAPGLAPLILKLAAAAVFAIATVRPRALAGLHWALSILLWPAIWTYNRLGGPDFTKVQLDDAPRRPRRSRSRGKPVTP
jgi:hypothetical protein